MLGLPDGIRACLFDLDGVLTQTARVHHRAWRETFDLLRDFQGDDFKPFTDTDYYEYVDGKPRRDGVRDFLASRGIRLPEGDPGDPPSAQTVAGVGNRKNEVLLRRLEQDGVEVYEGSVRYIRAARQRGLHTAVVTASANGEAVVRAAGLSDCIEARIDGVVADQEHLRGKPAPDTSPGRPRSCEGVHQLDDRPRVGFLWSETINRSTRAVRWAPYCSGDQPRTSTSR